MSAPTGLPIPTRLAEVQAEARELIRSLRTAHGNLVEYRYADRQIRRSEAHLLLAELRQQEAFLLSHPSAPGQAGQFYGSVL